MFKLSLTDNALRLKFLVDMEDEKGFKDLLEKTCGIDPPRNEDAIYESDYQEELASLEIILEEMECIVDAEVRERMFYMFYNWARQENDCTESELLNLVGLGRWTGLPSVEKVKEEHNDARGSN